MDCSLAIFSCYVVLPKFWSINAEILVLMFGALYSTATAAPNTVVYTQ